MENLPDRDQLLIWLKEANQRYGAEGIPHQRRPFQAMSEFTREHSCSSKMSDPLTRQILDWFYKRSPPKSHQVGSIYTGVHFYDTAFWPIHIPLIFGNVSISALDCLDTMPIEVKEDLRANLPGIATYENHWINCMDYGYGHTDLLGTTRLHPRPATFFSAAHFELIGANTQLLDPRPNLKAILGMRMATEIFLKTVLIQECDLTEDQLRKISHNLEGAAHNCAGATKERAFEEIGKNASMFPKISARYGAPEWEVSDVWRAASLAQLTAATVTRLYTNRDIRASVTRATS